MSPTVKGRLAQYCNDFQEFPKRSFHESWTFYPNETPVLIDCTFRWCPLSDGRPATLIEGRPMAAMDPVTVRGLDALLHSEVMTALFSEDGRALFANRAMRHYMEPIAQKFGDGFQDPTKKDAFLSALSKHGSHRETILAETINGLRWFDVQAGRCRDAATGQPAFHLSATDVTAMRRTEEELRAAHDQAQSADQAKSEFVANMSHEMRTPMNGVLGVVELLARTKLDDQQRHHIDILRDCGKALLHLIEEVLELSSMELGATRLKTSEVNLHEIAHSVVEGLRSPAEKKDLKVLLQIGPDVPASGICDGARLAQLMRNLIGNAIKYTENGWVLLSLDRVRENDLRVDVVDTGPGVPEADRARIFEKFTQLKDGCRPSYAGIGLGLAICHGLVTLLDGEIGVTAAETGGARFWFELPGVIAAESTHELRDLRASA
ncbi:MAG: ATP-binding protein [Paracoccaceae bacterium]